MDFEALDDLSLEDLISIRVPELVSVLGSHVHNEGEWMPMLMYRRMEMEGLRSGTSNLALSDVLLPNGSFMAAPTRMRTQMLMVGVMNGTTDRLTISAMLPWIDRSMDHVTAMGGTFTTKSSGIGDIRMAADYILKEEEDDVLLLNLAITLPTGSTNARGDTPAGTDLRLPYPMQLGSGTFDLMPGVTWQHESEHWTLGWNAGATLRLGRGDNGYSLGDQLHAGVWANRMVSDNLAARIRVDGKRWLNIDGADGDLNPNMVPTANPDFQGGSRIDFSVGLGTMLAGRRDSTWTVDLEFGLPIYEDLNGPALSVDHWIGLSYTLTF